MRARQPKYGIQDGDCGCGKPCRQLNFKRLFLGHKLQEQKPEGVCSERLESVFRKAVSRRDQKSNEECARIAKHQHSDLSPRPGAITGVPGNNTEQRSKRSQVSEKTEEHKRKDYRERMKADLFQYSRHMICTEHREVGIKFQG